jgi:DNA-binding transcriptional regulator YdaS (Cro superfamily)
MLDMKRTRTPILTEVLIHYGSITALARELGLTKAAVSIWNQVPMRHLSKISKDTGIPRQKLRPELYEDHQAA